MENEHNADRHLQELYGQPRDIVVEAWAPQLEETSISYIKNASLMLLSTVNKLGFVDISPRGGPPGFIAIPDDKHIAFLDQPGNKKLHSLHNVLNNPKVGLMFMIPGVKEILRVHGIAELSHDQGQIEKLGGEPDKNKTLVTIQIEKVFPHCPKALNFAQLWDSSTWVDAKEAGVPGLLDMAKAMAASHL
ncbi:MAG: hypothetical protein HOM44_12980 [Gammaproteobacteria bacterium]|jgi:uncharacterized protein|nr:hypothetical protein [Gammaproteobacteria bacterium]MBT5154992.1 hypothetical protein [Gammaproteobacteria bacterium]MBT5723336.1 hypothetical protein [Gammaproteobacteria bacterium]MDG1231399.1 pyridoxamine 5'-phosphate oxidase family protein [Pseudomonadales bacterium]